MTIWSRNAVATGYRPDLDGLRAIAVAGVILFHFGFEALSGGFVGVDVFFVISGFLITRLVASELSAGTFTFRSFYARRIRRIFPALAVMIITTLVAGYFFMLPRDYVALGWQSLFSLVGFGNVYFYRTSGYFDQSAELLPLLHTWSLGVEEQFYLFWPLFLIAAYRQKRDRSHTYIIIALAGVILISFISAVLLEPIAEKFAFFMLPTRAWELAIGSIMFFAPAIRTRFGSESVSVVGIGLILLSMIMLDASTPFPGPYALIPCVGAAFVIWPKVHPCTVSRVLATRPLVAIGLISYSLYLWHWPFAVMSNYTSFEMEPTLFRSATLLALSFSFAIGSYFIIERPFRGHQLTDHGKIFGGSILAAIAIVLSVGVIAERGAPWRLNAESRLLASGARDRSQHRQLCHTKSVDNSCVLGAPTASPTYAIWADSHGVEVGEAIANALAGRGASIRMLTSTSCPAALDFAPPERASCPAYSNTAIHLIEKAPEISTVILIAYYAHYFDVGAAHFEAGFRKAVDRLVRAGKTVIIFEPVPYSTSSIPIAAARNALVSPGSVLFIPLEKYALRNRRPLTMIADIARRNSGIKVVATANILCEKQGCPLSRNGRSLYFDNHHLSVQGASLLIAGAKDLFPPRHGRH